MRTLRLGVGHGKITKSKEKFDCFLEEIEEDKKKPEFDTSTVEEPKKAAEEDNLEEAGVGLEAKKILDAIAADVDSYPDETSIIEAVKEQLGDISISREDVINYIVSARAIFGGSSQHRQKPQFSPEKLDRMVTAKVSEEDGEECTECDENLDDKKGSGHSIHDKVIPVVGTNVVEEKPIEESEVEEETNEEE
jgi:hypothetical protein